VLFHAVNFLKCVVTEVVFFSVVAFRTLDISQGSVATHLRWTYFYLLKVANSSTVCECMSFSHASICPTF